MNHLLLGQESNYIITVATLEGKEIIVIDPHFGSTIYHRIYLNKIKEATNKCLFSLDYFIV
jgi:hypothetical protein